MFSTSARWLICVEDAAPVFAMPNHHQEGGKIVTFYTRSFSMFYCKKIMQTFSGPLASWGDPSNACNKFL